MDNEHKINSHLFTVRVWEEAAEDGRPEWRGKLRHIPSDETRYFRGWAALIPIMLEMLRRYNDGTKNGSTGPEEINHEN